jgi:DNA polymerase I
MLTQDSDKKLFLVDAYAIIFRAFFAFAKNPRINSKGLNTSAAFGFTNSLLEILKKEKPTHIAVVFDPPGGSVTRKESFEEYKANRNETPEGILSNIEPIKRIIESFNIPIIEIPGYEADDVIGTLSKIAESKGYLTYMVTPDKDYGQLVTEKSLMFRPGRSGGPAEIWGPKEICERFELDSVHQVIDYLGLMGDASDNIPGMPGVGPKTASKLLKEFGTMENIFANTDKLKGKQKETFETQQELGLLSKELATIITDVDVEFNEEELELNEPDPEKVRDIFTELEFKGFAQRVLGEEIVVSVADKPKDNGQLDLFGVNAVQEQEVIIPESLENNEPVTFKTFETEKPNYQLIQTKEDRAELFNLLMQQKEVCFDTETTALDALHADLVGMSFSFKAKEAFYVSIPSNKEEAQAIIEEFRPFFESTEIVKIAHNVKYDLKVLRRYNVRVAYPLFDTMIAHYLISPESKQNMDFLAEFYLQYQPISIETLIGKKGKNQGNMGDLTPEEVTNYACEDADITFQLKQIFAPEIEKDHLKSLFYGMEMPLVEILADMEKEGIAIDSAFLNEYSKELEVILSQLEQEIKALAGIDFNIDSPKQLGEVLFEQLQITNKAKKTKTGQYATSEDVLQGLIHTHPIVAKILDYRGFRKLKSTYVDPLPLLTDSIDSRVHTQFMQTVTATGRLSSNNPNLQNIPIRTEAGRKIRQAFIARDKEHILLAADYSQIELRIIAALSEDKNMIAAFKAGEDIHAATAAKVYQVPITEVTREQRSNAKAVNFGIIYGQSAHGLSQNLGITRTEAKQIIDSYFEQYTTIKSYMDGAIAQARERGYVETIFKRRRYLPDIHSANAVVRGFAERNAINAPIQGSAADVIKLAMVAVYKKMKEKNVRSRMLLQVHDELVFDIHKEEVEIMKELIQTEMENAVQLIVPMKAEIDMGNNWLEAH